MPGRFMPQVSRHDFLDSRLRGPESVVIAGLNEKTQPEVVRNRLNWLDIMDYKELIDRISLQEARRAFSGRSGTTRTDVGARPMICMSLGRDVRGPPRAPGEGDQAGIQPAGKTKERDKGQAEVVCHLRVLWDGQSATDQYDSEAAGGPRTGSKSIRGDE